MKTMLYFAIACVVLAVLVACTMKNHRKAVKEAPKSKLVCFDYSVGGGMEISQNDLVLLMIEPDGRRTLTLQGSEYNKYDTLEVDEEVFLKCDSIIHATRLYETEEPEDKIEQPLDAPISGFRVSYEDERENFSGTWGEGLDEVLDYLKSLRPDSTCVCNDMDEGNL